MGITDITTPRLSQAAPLTGPTGQSNLRFGRRGAERILAFSQAGRPQVALIDFFDKGPNDAVNRNAMVDVDGDDVPDTPHGVVFQRLLSGLAKTPFDCIRLPLPYLRADEPAPWLAQARQILKRCQQVERQIAKGQGPDILNLSLSFDGRFTGGNKLGGALPVTPETLHLQRPAILAALSESEDPFQQVLADLIRSLSRIARSGTTVYIGAGNGGPGRYNLLSLAEGTRTIGGNFDSADHRADYSANHSLVNCFTQSAFAVTRTEQGLDLTGDGRADIQASELPDPQRHPSSRADLNGQKLQDVLGSTDDLNVIGAALSRGQALSDLPQARGKVFSLMDLSMAALSSQEWINLETVARLQALGEYASLGGGRVRVYQCDAQGRLHWNADNSGRLDPVQDLQGTSYAPAVAIAEQLDTYA